MTEPPSWRPRPKQGVSWDPAQVPFPNPVLVQTTTKPLVLMSKLRLQGTPDLRSAFRSAW
jgi:hypothetical protein